MPRKKGSQLTAATVVDDDDTVIIVQDGVTKKAAKSLLGGDAGAVADDIAKQGGTDINRVKGLNRVAFIDDAGAAVADAAAPPKGGAWVYSPRGGVNGMRAKKPVPPGHWDIEDFGGVPDYSHGRTVTATSASPNITLSSTTGLFVGQKLRLAHTVTREIQSITDATNAVLTAAAGVDTTGGACYTDNVDAVDALVATAENFTPTDRGIVVHLAGTFYFSDTFHVRRRLDIRGVGQTDENKKPGTMLVFGADCDGVFFHSTLANDDPTSLAAYSSIRDLTIWCRDQQSSGHGMVVHVPITAMNVDVINFAENGIELVADTSEGSGNASGATFFRVRSGAHGKHGIHIYGGDANSCSFIACSLQACIGVGVYDESGLGNYFAGIHAEGNDGDSCVQATTTSGSASVGVDDAQHFWFNKPQSCLISIAGVTGTKEVIDIDYESRTSTVTDATNASPIVITTSGAHGLHTDDFANVSSVVGNTAANGTKRVTVIDSTHFSLNGTTGNGAYVSGGTVKDVFPSAVITVDSTCDATVSRARVANEDGQNHDYVVTGQGITASTLVGCYSEAAVNKIDIPSKVYGGILAQQPNAGTGQMDNGGILTGRPLVYRNVKGAVVTEIVLGQDDDLLSVLSFSADDGDYYTLNYNNTTKRWTLQCDASAEWKVFQLPTPGSGLRANGPVLPNGYFLSSRKIAAATNEIFVQAADRAPNAGEGTWQKGDIVYNCNPSVGQPIGWTCTVSGDPGTWVAWANL